MEERGGSGKTERGRERQIKRDNERSLRRSCRSLRNPAKVDRTAECARSSQLAFIFLTFWGSSDQAGSFSAASSPPAAGEFTWWVTEPRPPRPAAPLPRCPSPPPAPLGLARLGGAENGSGLHRARQSPGFWCAGTAGREWPSRGISDGLRGVLCKDPFLVLSGCGEWELGGRGRGWQRPPGSVGGRDLWLLRPKIPRVFWKEILFFLTRNHASV